jgi:hypothetical protein
MSTIAPKLSEFAMNTYSFPCNNVIRVMLHAWNTFDGNVYSDDYKPVRVVNRACRCSSGMGRCHHGQEGTFNVCVMQRYLELK